MLMNVLKVVVSIYRKGEEKPIERYIVRISISEDHCKGMENFKKTFSRLSRAERAKQNIRSRVIWEH